MFSSWPNDDLHGGVKQFVGSALGLFCSCLVFIIKSKAEMFLVVFLPFIFFLFLVASFASVFLSCSSYSLLLLGLQIIAPGSQT